MRLEDEDGKDNFNQQLGKLYTEGQIMTKEWQFYIAGVRHHDIHKVVDELKVEGRLSLSLEPTNKYDPNAVRIESEGTMIGYVPAKISAQVTAAVTSGKHNIVCEIVEFNPAEKPWKMCKVVVRKEDKK